MKRREFLYGAAGVGGTLGAPAFLAADLAEGANETTDPSPAEIGDRGAVRAFNGPYKGEYLSQIAFPVGGIGAGMFCVEGNGALSKFSFRHRLEREREHRVFAAIAIRGRSDLARVLEGPVPSWKLRPQFPGREDDGTGWGLPRFHDVAFNARFPFANVDLTDEEIPLQARLTAWSPFSPGDEDNASLPVGGLEYRFANRGPTALDAVFSFNAENILAQPGRWPPDLQARPRDRISATPGGYILYGAGSEDRAWDEGSCAAWVDDPQAIVNYDLALNVLDIQWRQFASGQYVARAPLRDRSAAGASLFVPLTLGPGEVKTITVKLAWYVPNSDLFEPTNGIQGVRPIAYPRPPDCYQPWYARRFGGIQEVIQYWQTQYVGLRQATQAFSHALFDSTLPPEVMEAVAANLSILKSTTVLRQTDGRLWGWEGSYPESQSELTGVSGTTTHVWNYAQSIPHLFPKLERSLRETEFGPNQNDEGLQYCRAALPIRPVESGHTWPDGPAADGQLGGIIKMYRDWRIAGDTTWLRRLWPRVRASLDYCIRTWDPAHRGVIEEPHLTTYDTEFWGADSYCTSLYLGALKAAISMGEALEQSVDLYSQLLHRGVRQMEMLLFNGEYFSQSEDWRNLRATFSFESSLWTLIYNGSPDLLDVVKREGPPGQYWKACPSDGVMGLWLANVCGVGGILDERKVGSHLASVYRYNFKQDLTEQTNFRRASFACGDEAGLVLCSWPRGGRPFIPMFDSDEVWTGVEYQVASHLIAIGRVEAGLDMVRGVRGRYDGRIRNPFSEVEAGHWYARAMSSYALLQALSGARFDAVDKTLYLKPSVKGDFRSFLATATGYATVGIRHGQPFVEVLAGKIPYNKIAYTAAV